jgi:hypothetical protein
LTNVAFLLTNNDKWQKTREEIKAQIGAKTLEAMGLRNSHLPLFFYQLAQKHFVVDYTRQGREELFAEMERVFGSDDEAAKTASFNHTALDVEQNKLNQIGFRAIDEELRKLTDHGNRFKKACEQDLTLVGTLCLAM